MSKRIARLTCVAATMASMVSVLGAGLKWH